MAEHSAIPIREVAGALETDDGQHLLLKLIQTNGAEIVLAIPQGQAPNLVSLAAMGFPEAGKANVFGNASVKPVFDVTWWEISVEKERNATVLSLTFGSAATLNFRLADGMPEQILETLQVMLGKSNPQTPETSRN